MPNAIAKPSIRAPKAIPKATSIVCSARPSSSKAIDNTKTMKMLRRARLKTRGEGTFALTAANRAAREKKLAASSPKNKMNMATNSRGKKRKNLVVCSCRPRIPSPQEQTTRFFLFLPRLFVAMFILFFGLLAASFFSRAALLAAVNANVPSPRVLSLALRSIIIVFVLSIVFEELGLAEQTMLVAFGIAFGALMLGLAIAFGMGGRDLARRFLEKRIVRGKKEENEDELSPL